MTKLSLPKIIAVDFDGTCVDHRFPDIGPNAPGAVVTLQELAALGTKLIIVTMRGDEYLDEAVKWWKYHEIPLFGVNNNPEQKEWTSSPKAYAQLYIDDAALGAPLIQPAEFRRPCVDWIAVRRILGLPPL